MNPKWLKYTKKYEGLNLHAYLCPGGKLTIGYGHNLDENGITPEVAHLLLQTDLAAAHRDVAAKLPCMEVLTEARQFVLVDMCFNMGIKRLLGFKKMLSALKAGDYERAAAEMLDSRWAAQVGRRAKELAEMMKTGVYYD